VSTTKRCGRALIALAALLPASACGYDAGDRDDDRGFDFNTCKSDEECPNGQVCWDQFWGRGCVAGCRSDAGCPEDTYCPSRSQVWVGCNWLVCEPPPFCTAGCREDQECGADSICSDHQCVAGCRADADCPSQEVCAQNVCTPGCRTDAECAAGLVCLRGECTAPCVDDQGCPGGSVCSKVGYSAAEKFDFGRAVSCDLFRACAYPAFCGCRTPIRGSLLALQCPEFSAATLEPRVSTDGGASSSDEGSLGP